MRALLLACSCAWVLAAQPADPQLHLLRAIAKGDMGAVEAALAAGAQPGLRDPRGITPLELALLFGRAEAADRLLGLGVPGLNELHDFVQTGKDRMRPLNFAARQGSRPLVEVLLRRGADVRALDEDGRGALERAVRAGDPEVVRRLLQAGADPGGRNPDGFGPVFVAVLSGKVEVLRVLLDHGGRADAREDHGESPLMAAAELGQEGVLRLLLERGAPVHPLDAWGQGALAKAKACKDAAAGQRMAEALVKAGAREGEPLRTVDSAFLNAVADGNLDKAKGLLARGADLHARGRFDGERVLSDALSLSVEHRALCRFLLDAGINPHMRSSYDFTALHSAARDGGPEVIGWLVAAGLDPKAPSRSGMVPLYMAINGRARPANVAALLRAGADPNARTPRGETLLAFARGRKQTEVVRLLAAAGARDAGKERP